MNDILTDGKIEILVQKICLFLKYSLIIEHFQRLIFTKIPLCFLCPPHWGGWGGGWTYYFSFFHRPVSHLVSGHFKAKVFILSLPNLVWVFIGLIACMGLLLVKIAL